MSQENHERKGPIGQLWQTVTVTPGLPALCGIWRRTVKPDGEIKHEHKRALILS